MTAQVSEKLICNGEEICLRAEPLRSWLSFWGFDGLPNPSGMAFSCCWRGYVGTWEITADRLYLVDIYAFGDDAQDSTLLSYLFPHAEEKVFARWVSGRFRATRGEVVGHDGIASIFEEDIYFEICHGHVHSVEVKKNDPSQFVAFESEETNAVQNERLEAPKKRSRFLRFFD